MDVRGALVVSRRALAGARNQVAQLVVVNGAVGIVAAPHGRPIVLAFTVVGDRITAIDVIADANRLAGLDLSVLE